MGGMESDGEERAWFLNELKGAKEELGFEGWEDVLKELREVIWYEDVHDVMFRELSEGKGQFKGPEGAISGTGSRFGGYKPIASA